MRAPAHGGTMRLTAASDEDARRPASTCDGPEHPVDGSGRGYAWYVVFVLLLIYVIAYVDRQIIGVLVEPIQRDLNVGDTEMSLLLGAAFAVFYTVVGLPMGWLADRANRRNLILGGLVVWSVGTAACGLARSFGQLVLARMSVGLGEACLNPAVAPLLRDYFPQRSLGKAVGVYMLGISIGGGAAYIAGGALLPLLASEELVALPLVGALPPWQAALIALGGTGLLMALLLLTVREPDRIGRLPQDAKLSLADTFAHVRRHWLAYTALIAPVAASAVMTIGVGAWAPSFFQRSFTLDEAAAGRQIQIYGLASMVFGAMGVLAGGALADHLGHRRADGHVRTLALGAVLIAIGYGPFALAPNPTAAIAIATPGFFGAGVLQATGITALMSTAPAAMRGQIAALSFFVVNVLGGALGPTLIAVITDYGFGSGSMLRFSLAIVSIATCAGALALIAIGRSACLALRAEAAS